MNRSTPPSSSPSTCSRKAARIVASSRWSSSRVGAPSGPIEPATRASRPATSRASRATWAARRLRRAASPARPNAASRIRFAPNVAVSMISAPAARYARWIAPTRSGRVVASSSRHARCGTPLEKSSVPIPPSSRIGALVRRSRNRSRSFTVVAYPRLVTVPRRRTTSRRPSAWSRIWGGRGRPL